MTEPVPIVRHGYGQTPGIFDRVAIVGVGLIGGSLAAAVRRLWPRTLIIGVDRKAVIERATVAHVIDVGADDLGMVTEAELIVLAAPVNENVRILRDELPALVSRQVVVTDVGGTKRAIASAASHLPSHLTFIGGHPIAGAAVAGFEHARADLFTGRPWILCPTHGVDAAKLVDFVTAIGARSVLMSPEQHDRVFAFLSHLPQLTTSAIMHVIGQAVGEENLRLAGEGLRDATRLASSPTDLWRAVSSSNADEIRSAIDVLVSVLQEVRDDLDRGDALAVVFESARKWKAELERK